MHVQSCFFLSFLLPSGRHRGCESFLHTSSLSKFIMFFHEVYFYKHCFFFEDRDVWFEWYCCKKTDLGWYPTSAEVTGTKISCYCKYSLTLSDSFSCPHEGLSGVIWTPIRYETLHFRDRCGVASLRYKHRAEITVLMSAQKSYPVWFSYRRKSFPVQCKHRLLGSQVAWVASVSVRFRSNERGTEVNDQKWPPRPPPPPSFIFWLSFLFSRGQSRESPSSIFLCFETKRKRLLRRLEARVLHTNQRRLECSTNWQMSEQRNPKCSPY